MYSLAKRAHIPFSTISDLCNGKKNIENITLINAYKISEILAIPIEDLLKEEKTQTFIRSEICHELKESGDLIFLEIVIDEDRINKLLGEEKYFEALYTLGVVDFLCNKYKMPLFPFYEKARQNRFPRLIYPEGVALKIKYGLTTEEEIRKTCLPEFLKFNIAEENIYNVA